MNLNFTKAIAFNSHIVNKADPHFSVKKKLNFFVTNDFTVTVFRLIYSF